MSGVEIMAIITIDVHELPERYAEAVSIAELGNEVLITSEGHPSARFVPLPLPTTKPRIFGMHLGSMTMAPDFDEPLPDEFWLGDS